MALGYGSFRANGRGWRVLSGSRLAPMASAYFPSAPRCKPGTPELACGLCSQVVHSLKSRPFQSGFQSSSAYDPVLENGYDPDGGGAIHYQQATASSRVPFQRHGAAIAPASVAQNCRTVHFRAIFSVKISASEEKK